MTARMATCLNVACSREYVQTRLSVHHVPTVRMCVHVHASMHACVYYERTLARVLRHRIHSVRTCEVVYKRMFAGTRLYVYACSASVKCAHVRARASMLARVYTCMRAFVHARMQRVHASTSARRRVRVPWRVRVRVRMRIEVVHS
jgi:hypothetical protein